MRRIYLPLVLTTIGLALCWTHPWANACDFDPQDLEQMSLAAVSENPTTANRAIKALRDAGPEGLKTLLTVHAADIRQHAAEVTLGAKLSATAPAHLKQTDAQIAAPREAFERKQLWTRLTAALDQVSGQHDCHASQLYWYTDLDAAKQAARRKGKPILSLRLLGKLTDEYSCANSRFFRTTLYSNQEIGAYLRNNFILHWKSVRPAPRITIDMGDGRRLTRTITGNSIHYVLDCDGNPIDALPGLYGPQAFLRELQRDNDTAKQSASLQGGEREKFLHTFHRERVDAIREAWLTDLVKVGATFSVVNDVPAASRKSSKAESPQVTPESLVGIQPQPSNGANGYKFSKTVTFAKGSIEDPIIRAFELAPIATIKRTPDDVWDKIAQLHREDAQLDAASMAVIRNQNPTAAQAAPRAISKGRVENPLLRMVRSFQGAIALDTVRNEYLFHEQIHLWLVQTPTPVLDQLNERVYAELFLTPSSDPWLGLVPSDTYSALDNNGIQ